MPFVIQGDFLLFMDAYEGKMPVVDSVDIVRNR